MKGILKGKNIKVPAKASMWYVGASVLTKATGLLFTPIFTRILTGEEYGAYSLYMSYLGFFSLICAAGFSAGVIYKGFQDFSTKKEVFLSASLGFSVCFSSTICILLFAFSGVFGILPELSLILCFQLILDSAVGLSLMQKRYFYKYRAVTLVCVFESLAAPLFSLSLLFGTELGFAAKLWGLLIPALIACSPLVIGIMKKSLRLFDKEIWTYLFKRSLPLFPSALSGAFSSSIASFVLVKIMGNSALAKYSVTHTVGIGLLFVVSALGASLSPWITRKLSENKRECVSEVVTVLFTLLSAATLVLIALVPEVIAFLAPSEYGEAISAALPIALSTLPSFITGISGGGLVFCDMGRRVSLSATLGAVSNFLFCLILIPSLEYFGAGLALLLSGLISLSVSLCFLHKTEHFKIIGIRRVVAVFLLTAAFGVLISLFYNYAPIRILLLLIPFTVFLRTLPSALALIREKRELT